MEQNVQMFPFQHNLFRVILKLLIVYKIKHDYCNESFHFLWKSKFQVKIIIILFQILMPEQIAHFFYYYYPV